METGGRVDWAGRREDWDQRRSELLQSPSRRRISCGRDELEVPERRTLSTPLPNLLTALAHSLCEVATLALPVLTNVESGSSWSAG